MGKFGRDIDIDKIELKKYQLFPKVIKYNLNKISSKLCPGIIQQVIIDSTDCMPIR